MESNVGKVGKVMVENKNCPCEIVKELEKKVEDQKERLNKGSVEFATINTKLNMLMAILGAIGTAVVGLVVKMMF